MTARPSWSAERFWPGATEPAARLAMERIGSACRALAGTGVAIRYLGGTLALVDELLTCRFDGDADAVRSALELAGEPFDRLVAVVDVPAPSAPT